LHAPSCALATISVIAEAACSVSWLSIRADSRLPVAGIHFGEAGDEVAPLEQGEDTVEAHCGHAQGQGGQQPEAQPEPPADGQIAQSRHGMPLIA